MGHFASVELNSLQMYIEIQSEVVDSTILNVNLHSKNEMIINMTPKGVNFHSWVF